MGKIIFVPTCEDCGEILKVSYKREGSSGLVMYPKECPKCHASLEPLNLYDANSCTFSISTEDVSLKGEN